MKVLVAGGAGYIGSHMCELLHQAGHQMVVCDNLSTGHRQAVQWGTLVQCPLADGAALDRLFEEHAIDAVIHFAAASIVPESVADPLRYYENNVSDTISLLQAMRRNRVSRLVFSSTAAIFGEPRSDLIDENHPTAPLSPYGSSKLMVEQVLQDCCRAYELRAATLRYFNAAGASQSARIGEAHQPETHLIPRLLRAAAGENMPLHIYGTDYPTADGTCVRDYVHVTDLCKAHLLALDHLHDHAGFHAFNLGNGIGYSVSQVVSAAEEIIGRKLDIPVAARRPGDPATLVASSEKARLVLGWNPSIHDIREIIESAWQWHRSPAF